MHWINEQIHKLEQSPFIYKRETQSIDVVLLNAKLLVDIINSFISLLVFLTAEKITRTTCQAK